MWSGSLEASAKIKMPQTRIHFCSVPQITPLLDSGFHLLLQSLSALKYVSPQKIRLKPGVVAQALNPRI